MKQITYDYFEKVAIRVGKIIKVEDFPKARKPEGTTILSGQSNQAPTLKSEVSFRCSLSFLAPNTQPITIQANAPVSSKP